jgi:hypothetical protein
MPYSRRARYGMILSNVYLASLMNYSALRLEQILYFFEDPRMLARHTSISDSDHTPARSHALPAKVANLSVLVVADVQEVSRCKCLLMPISMLHAPMERGYYLWRSDKCGRCIEKIMFRGINHALNDKRDNSILECAHASKLGTM